MRARHNESANNSRHFLLLPFVIGIALFWSVSFSYGQIDSNINKSVWKMLYGATDAQVNSSTWLAADDDGDGLSNGAELAAGTNPFKPNSTLQVATVTSNSTTVSMAFPTINKKLYTAQATASLNPLNWQPVAGISVVGDGTSKTLVVPKTAGAFFRVVVQDQSTASDQVADWAKQILGYAPGSSISSQSIYDHISLANALAAQNVVTVSATDPSVTQPGDSVTPPSDLGIITFTRSGYQLFSSITVPILKSGTAIEGTDYAALPNSVTFPPWVSSVTLNITPLFNPSRTNSTTVNVTAQAGGGYTLGAATSASTTIYPAAVANGTGLSGAYFGGASASYTNGAGLGVITANYTFTPTSSTTGNAVVTYTGAPAVPFAVGTPVTLTFTTGPLFLSSNNFYNGTYNITAIGTNTFTVPITVNGVTMAGAGSGNVTVNPFSAPTNASNFGGIAVTYSYTKLTTTTGTAVISYNGTPATPFAVNGTATLQFTSGNLFSGSAAGVYDGTYSITAVSGGTGSGTLTVSITGPAVPSTGTGNATLTPFNAPAITRVDPTVDFIWGTQQPTNTSLQTATNNNWAGRWDSFLNPTTTGTYTFDVQAFDGARVYVNNTLIIDAWSPGSSSYTPMTSAALAPAGIALTAGTRVAIRVEYYHLNGTTASINLRWKVGAGSFTSIPSANTFLTSAGSVNGWTGLYWTNIGGTAAPTTFTAFYGPPRYGDFPNSITNLSWPSQPSATITSPTSFSIRWEGYLKPSTSGIYSFDIQASDGARVYLDLDQNGTFDAINANGDNETIIDAWTPADNAAITPMPSVYNGSTNPTGYNLNGGQVYRIRVEYYQSGNASTTNALVNLRWNLNGGAMSAIPAANVVRTDPISGAALTTTGLFATYYNNSTLTDPPLYAAQDTSASTITYNYGTGKPSTGSLGSAGSNNWAARFDTYIKTTSTVGVYGFQLVAQSAGRLVFNNNEIIPFTAGTSTATTSSLTANTLYPVRVEMYDIGANGSAVLSWKPGNTGSFVTVPTTAFFQDAGGTTAGVVGTYWADTAFVGDPYFVDYQTQINYNKGSGQPGDTWTVQTFSATWDGYLLPTSSGNHLFTLLAQSQARVYLNGNLILDGWTVPGSAGTNPIQSAPINLTAGTRVPIHVDYANSTTGASFINVQWEPPTAQTFTGIPNTALFRNASTSQQGLLATWYANSTQTPPFFYQVAENNNPELNYTFGQAPPGGSLASTNFTVRWKGQVLPQYSEPYQFAVKSDDGARLWVNGQLVINKWQSQGTTENISAPINLQAGVFYDIQLEYLQLTAGAEVHLNWFSADQVEQVIPSSRLYPAITGVPQAGPTGVTSSTGDVYIANSGSPYSYPISGSNGPSTYSATGLPPGLTLNGNVISGTLTTPGNYQFTVTTTNAAGTSSEVVNLQVIAAPGIITRETWTGLAGPNVSDIPVLSAPNATDTALTTLEDTNSYGNNTGERLRGYFTAPATGNYYFWIAGSGGASDANHTVAELWISDSDQAVAKIRRAFVGGTTGTGSRVWNAQASQTSPWLSLVGGQRYYFEVLHNTGASGASSNLAVGWFMDPTGNTANPIANGAGPAANVSAAGIVPTFVLWPWDNPPTTTTPGIIYVASLAGPANLNGIKGSGGAFIRVNGTTGVVHLNYSGLTSGAISQGVYAAGVGNNPPTLLFDLGAQDKNYPTLKTSDGGYTWNMQGSDLTSLQNGNVFLSVATTANPITVNNPYGELTGTFGKVTGSQVAPALPSYTSPSWTDNHATNDASNSRFLTQATFGPSPSDMSYVKTNGYRAWMENQFGLSASHNVPYVLSHLSGDPQNPYNDPLFFNSWWKNSVTAPDQLRQRVAFALSEILVTSDVGPLNNNDRPLADYYDNLVDYAFTDFRTLLKQVTLTPAMGLYLNMQGNYKGSNQTGLHPNENYAREIMQLFSIGLYRLWPDGSLVLDSNGDPIPTYDQSVITGMAHALTGWNWGQALSGGRLPTGGPATNYLDPMVLIASQHELGTKLLLDNVVRPPAIVISQSDTSHDPNPNPITIQSTDPVLGPGNVVSTSITSTYDLYGLRDLEASLDSIMNNGDVAPFICRQLIQRLVTSNPKPEYLYRVVRAFNGERNIDGVSTGIVGDMKDVIRAILLDPEARSSTEAADNGFGKQREPLLRITAAARAFPPTAIPNSTYREQGRQTMLITTPAAHRLTNGDTVLLDTFADLTGSGGSTTNLPYPQGYSVGNTTPSYTYVGATHIATISAPGYKAGDSVNLQFTSGTLGTTTPYSNVQTYSVLSAVPDTGTAGSFTINIGGASPPSSNTSGSAFTPNNFTVNNNGVSAPSYTISGNTVTITASGYTAGHQLYVQFTSGSAAGGSFDGVYTIATATGSAFTITLSGSPGSTGGSTLIPRLSGGYTITTIANNSTITLQTANNFDVAVGDQIWVDFLVTLVPQGAVSGVYTVTGVPGNNLITISSPSVLTAGTESTNGMVAYPLNLNAATRNGTVTVNYGTFNVGNTTTNSTLNQAPLNAATVFNFFYPDYKYPGAIAQAGMTTPEFQLTDDSDTMNLTNAVTTSILSAGNTNGFTSFNSGNGSIVMDLGAYMTQAQTQNSAIPTLVSTLGTLLTGGNLTSASQTTISNYVANTTNFPFSNPPTNTQMRDRVRAIVHLILTSSEFAIQK
jgi:uncharacterized protein (DUF1800 family)